MDVTGVLMRGRTAAEALMADTCTVRRVTGETTSGGVVTAETEDVYAGRCRIQVRSQSGQGETIGEAYQIVARIELQLPISAAALLADDLVTVTSATHDPQLVGKEYRVRDVLAKTHATSRRATLIEVTS